MEVAANVTMNLLLAGSISKELQEKEWLLRAYPMTGVVLYVKRV